MVRALGDFGGSNEGFTSFGIFADFAVVESEISAGFADDMPLTAVASVFFDGDQSSFFDENVCYTKSH